MGLLMMLLRCCEGLFFFAVTAGRHFERVPIRGPFLALPISPRRSRRSRRRRERSDCGIGARRIHCGHLRRTSQSGASGVRGAAARRDPRYVHHMAWLRAPEKWEDRRGGAEQWTHAQRRKRGLATVMTRHMGPHRVSESTDDGIVSAWLRATSGCGAWGLMQCPKPQRFASTNDRNPARGRHRWPSKACCSCAARHLPPPHCPQWPQPIVGACQCECLYPTSEPCPSANIRTSQQPNNIPTSHHPNITATFQYPLLPVSKRPNNIPISDQYPIGD